jgi:hypothetical protein
MNSFLSFFNFFNPKKSELSSFYVATLISFFIFNVASQYIVSLSAYIIRFLDVVGGFRASNGQLWYCLFIVSLVLTVALKSFVVDKLGFGIVQDSKGWETFASFAIIMGFFVFVINQAFVQPMPDSIPLWLVKILGGEKSSTLGLRSANEAVVWSIIPWIWTFAPIAVFFYPAIKTKPKSE